MSKHNSKRDNREFASAIDPFQSADHYGDAADTIVSEVEVVRDEAVKPVRMVVINTRLLNVRKDPSVDSSIVDVITLGTSVKVHENVGDWCKVQFTKDGQSMHGYTLRKYLGESNG